MCQLTSSNQVRVWETPEREMLHIYVISFILSPLSYSILQKQIKVLPAFRQRGSEKCVNTMRQGLWEAIHDSVSCIRGHASSLTSYLFYIFLFSLRNIKNMVKFLTLGRNIKQKVFLAFQQHLNIDSAWPKNQASWRRFLILGRDIYTGLLDLPCTIVYDFLSFLYWGVIYT